MVRRSGGTLALLAVFILVFQGIFGSVAWAREGNPQATGLIEPTAGQREWLNKNFPLIQKIRFNELALQRINTERAATGLPSLAETAVMFEASTADSGLIEGTGSALAAVLPGAVDNSASPAFPPIRSQGTLNSCVAWATTYYQLTYETNLALNRTASGGDNKVIFSPKWAYNMINRGLNSGSTFADAYSLALNNGAASWSDFPYDSDYLAWCLDPAAWSEAINYRPQSLGQLSTSDTDTLISNIKTLLTNGRVIVIATFVNSWVQKVIVNDTSTNEDDAFAGQKIASYLKNTQLGGHGMTIVGYNDNLWCDLNGNGLVDVGEKGAFKIANSWGTLDWNQGYRWVTYDSLRTTSAVPASGTWPTADRAYGGIFLSGNVFTLTASAANNPTLKAEVTLNQPKRSQLAISLGIGDTTATAPATTWNSKAINYSGGTYAFNGTSTACDGTFTFDFSDLAKGLSGNKRWFVRVSDNAAGDVTTLKSFKLYQVTASGDVLVATCTDVPKTVDAGQTSIWVDYSMDSFNQPPTAAFIATPASGIVPLTVSLDGTASSDSDGTIASYAWSFGDGTATGSGSKVSHLYSGSGTFTAALTVTDNKGATGTRSLTISAVGANQPPTAAFKATPSSGKIPLTVSFDGTASRDSDGSIISYAWNFGDGTAKGYGSKVSHLYSRSGTFTATLTVTDNKGATGTRSLTISAVVANQPPTAAFKAAPSSGKIPLTVSFDGTASRDSDGYIVSYAWNFGDGTAKGYGSKVSHLYSRSGTFTATLTVTDNKGATGTKSLTISAVVANQPPTAAFKAAPSSGKIPLMMVGAEDFIFNRP